MIVIVCFCFSSGENKLVDKIAGSRNTPEPETKTQLRNEEL